MKSNKNIIERTLLKKTLTNFIIKVVLFTIAIPTILILISEIINRINFQWLYNISPNMYFTIRNFFNFIYSYNFWFFAIILIWITGMIILLYKLLKKVFSYMYELRTAANQLLDKNIEYIKLPSELEEIENQMNHIKYTSEKNERLARENEQRKNDLIVYLAHDLKTPLTSVIGYLELLKEAPDLPIQQRKKYTNITLEKAYRLEELMNEFFEVARFNDTNIVLMKKNLNLKLMLEQIIDEFFPIMNELNKDIVIDCDSNIICYADSDKLFRALNNVIKNAIYYSFENTVIKIFVTVENKIINIYVENEGYTIPESKLNSIFEKFYRLDDARSTNNGGSGLGLAIAKEIINAHGGTINAKSENNKITFILSIPLNIK